MGWLVGRSHHNGSLPAQVDQPPTPHTEFIGTLDRIARTGLDPRYVFLDASAVMRRYGWGRTKGDQNLKNRELVPAPVMTHSDVGASTSYSLGKIVGSRRPKTSPSTVGSR